MTKFRIRFCLCAIFIAIRPVAASAQSSRAAIDPVFTKVREMSPLYRDSATRRLEILTEIWGNVGLYHAVPSAERLKWDDVLIAGIRELPSVRTDRDFANLLNRIVFAPLHDPLLYATTRTQNDVDYVYPAAFETRVLSPQVAYVSAVNKAYAGREIIPQLRAIIDSASKRPGVQTLLVDLRSSSATSYRPGLPTRWLGMWMRETRTTAKQISVLRTTSEGMDAIQWIVSPGDSLAPVTPAVAIPTVFLVNRTSYAVAERALDALRASRNDVAVMFEDEGPIPNLGYNGFKVYYPDSILLPHSHTARLSSDGALGTVADVVIPAGTPFSELLAASGRALAARRNQPVRTAFKFEDTNLRDDSLTSPLSREQKIAGLMKIWFRVSRFYAYPDAITGDWRRLPATWVSRVASTPDDRSYYRILEQISALLNDTHSGVRHPLIASKQGNVPPLYLQYVQNHVIVVRSDTTAASLRIAPGDELLGMNGRTMKQLEDSIYPYWSISKLKHRAPIRSYVIGAKDSMVTLRLRSASGVHEIVLPHSRGFLSVYGQMHPEHPAFAVLPGNIGYINLGWIDKKPEFDSALTALAKTRGMILDDRSINAAESEWDIWPFIDKPAEWLPRVESISSWHDDYAPTIGFGMTTSWMVPVVKASRVRYTKPIVLMTSNDNISHGETLAMLLRTSRRAVIVGEATNGTSGSQEGVKIPGGATFTFTTGRQVFTDGTTHHGVGVVPDVIVEPTIAGIRAGRDEVYEKALSTLRAIVK